jgi:hypothetical protein
MNEIEKPKQEHAKIASPEDISGSEIAGTDSLAQCAFTCWSKFSERLPLVRIRALSQCRKVGAAPRDGCPDSRACGGGLSQWPDM